MRVRNRGRILPLRSTRLPSESSIDLSPAAGAPVIDHLPLSHSLRQRPPRFAGTSTTRHFSVSVVLAPLRSIRFLSSLSIEERMSGTITGTPFFSLWLGLTQLYPYILCLVKLVSIRQLPVAVHDSAGGAQVQARRPRQFGAHDVPHLVEPLDAGGGRLPSRVVPPL